MADVAYGLIIVKPLKGARLDGFWWRLVCDQIGQAIKIIGTDGNVAELRVFSDGVVVDTIYGRINMAEIGKTHLFDSLSFHVRFQSFQVLAPVEIGVQEVTVSILGASGPGIEIGEVIGKH